MMDLRDKSGKWKGQWFQPPYKGTMSCVLHFGQGEISGGGSDASGTFKMDGSYDQFSNEVAITKSYTTLFVIYRGKWDGALISGFSKIYGPHGFFDEGHFELWPENDEMSLERLMEEVDQPLAARV